MSMRVIAFSAGLFALLIAGLILWLGLASTRGVERLIAEGQIVQGEFVNQTTDHNRGSDIWHVKYRVGDKDYSVTSRVRHSGRSAPLIDDTPAPMPQFGPEEPLQVVYLPSDPAIARLRSDLSTDNLPYYLASGFLALIGLAMVAAARFLLPKSRRPRWRKR